LEENKETLISARVGTGKAEWSYHFSLWQPIFHTKKNEA
jgi:hypothetical protein